MTPQYDAPIESPEESRLQALAGLRLNEGYQYLLAIFDDELHAIEAAMSDSSDVREGLRLMRHWQTLLRVRGLLGNTPEAAREELEKLRAEAPQHEEFDLLSPHWARPV